MNFFKLSGQGGILAMFLGLLTFPPTFTSSLHAGAHDEARRYCTQV